MPQRPRKRYLEFLVSPCKELTIGEFYRDQRRDDLSVLYFTGHGLKDDYGRLYLAMANTRLDNLQFTGLSGNQISEAMR